MMIRTGKLPAEGLRAWIGMLCVLLLTGCGGKIPTWDELTKSGSTPSTPGQADPNAKQPVITSPQPQDLNPPKPRYEEVIASFKQLRPGEIDNSSIASLTSLNEGLDQVTEINASNSKVTDEGLANLYKLTSLRVLALDGTKVGEKGCEEIGKVPSLEELTLTGGFLTDAGMAALQNLTNLKKLIINGTQMSSEGYAIIGRLPAIEIIEIMHSSVDDESMDALCEANTLHSLRMNDTKVTDKGLASLGKLEYLSQLNVSGCPVTCEGLGVAIKGKGLKKLLEISVTNTPLNERGAAAIGGMNSLEILNVAGLRGMQDKHLAMMVKGKKNLRVLLVNRNPGLTNGCLVAVKPLKELERLDISENKGFNDDGLKQLVGNKKLKILNWQDTSISAAGYEKLKNTLPELGRSDATGVAKGE